MIGTVCIAAAVLGLCAQVRRSLERNRLFRRDLAGGKEKAAGALDRHIHGGRGCCRRQFIAQINNSLICCQNNFLLFRQRSLRRTGGGTAFS